MNIPMGDMMLVEEVLEAHGHGNSRVIAFLDDGSRDLTDTVRSVDVLALLDDGRVANVTNRDDGTLIFIDEDNIFHRIRSWKDFLPSVDVQEWAECRGLLPR